MKTIFVLIYIFGCMLESCIDIWNVVLNLVELWLLKISKISLIYLFILIQFFGYVVNFQKKVDINITFLKKKL